MTSLKSFSQQPAYFLFAQDQFEGIDIYSLIQDHDHNYWFATDQGIYFHDGYTFEKVEHPKMRANSVFNFVINSKGDIFCSNLNQQVFRLRNKKCDLIFNIPDKGSEVNLLVNNEDELYISTSKKAYVLNASNVLIHTPVIIEHTMLGAPFLTADGRIIQHFGNNSKLLVYQNKRSFTKELVNFIRSEKEDDQFNFIRLGSTTYAINYHANQVFPFDEGHLRVNVTASIENNSLSHLKRTYTTSENLWIANNVSGVYVANEKFNSVFGGELLFSEYLISHVFEDDEGNILLATFDHGIIVIPDMQYPDIDPAFEGLFVTRLLSDASRGMFIGTRNGGLLNYRNQVSVVSSNSTKGIETLFYWPKHNLIFDDTKKVRIHDINTLAEGSALAGSLKDAIALDDQRILVALNSGVYVYSYDGHLKRFWKSDTLSTERGYTVSFEKTSNTVYYSTSSGLFYGKLGKKKKPILFNGEAISALDMEVYHHKTIVATAKHGFFVIEKGKIIQHHSPTFNGKELSVFKLKTYKDKVYANTQIGLVIMRLDGTVLHHLNKASGLSTNKIVDFEIYNGELWITHNRGIQRINLDKFKIKKSRPKIEIKSVKVNNQISSTTIHHFDHTSRRFEFEFSTYTLKNRDNITYWYKLVGTDEEWSINDYEDNRVLYNALGPGNYTLLLKAENNGVFSATIEYKFSIAKPFYQEWWFWGILALLGILIISLIYRRQLKIQQRKAKQQNELNASKLTAIQSQMNPHFIFNSLNSIQDLVLKGDVDNSYTFITKFSNLVRRTLNYSDKDFIDFEQEIKLIELYLSLEKLRFKDDIVFEINTNGIEDVQIPPMLIQPFIENALVHGLLHKDGLKTLTLNFTLKEVLCCEIIDNGIGREKALEIKRRQRGGHESFAINAINKRFVILREHYNNKVGFEYEDLMENGEVLGTKVVLKIPIQYRY